MVNSPHEGMHRIFQERPEVIAPVFKARGLPLPAKAAIDVITPDVTETKPVERRMDTLLKITPSDGKEFLLVIEAQSKEDAPKEHSWPYYVAFLRTKYKIPVLLLVVCRDRKTATWAAGPFDSATHGWTAQRTTPMVVGPDNLPVITSERVVRESPAMAVFSALTHASHPDIDAILDAVARGLQAIGEDENTFFSEFLEFGLGNTPAREKWRNLMPVTFYPGRGSMIEKAYLEGQAEGQAEGRAEGQAKLILRLLEHRLLQIGPEARERVMSCTDTEILQQWFDRALTVGSAEELFAEDHGDDGETKPAEPASEGTEKPNQG
jgi:hypothetical protein